MKIIKDEFGIIDFDVLGHSGNINIGGDDFDYELINHCVQKFNTEHKIFISTSSKEGRLAIKYLKIHCEKAKRILSNEYKTSFAIKSLYNGKDFCITIKRAEFEDICKNLFDKIIEPIQKALKVSKLNKYDIDEVLLVGGSTRMPKIEEKLKDFFGNKILIEKSYNPDELVAYGATLQAAKCMNCTAIDDVMLNDICSHSVGIEIKGEVFNDEFSLIIKNGENIPFSSERDYTTTHDYQRSALIQVFEGENSLCRNNRLLGSFYINNITPAKKGIPKIKVKIEIDQDGILKAFAKDTTSGANNSLIIKADKGIMSEVEKERMKQRLSIKEYFEKLKGNKEEKYLLDTIKNLRKHFRETHEIKTFFEIKIKQEKLIDICRDEVNKDNVEKLYMNIQYLFYLYKYIFNNCYPNNKKESSEYIKKIKIYMNLFKSCGTYYLKSLLMIFKDDTCIERISQIVYNCIKIYKDILSDENNNKLALYYIKEILELTEKFKKSIFSSSLKLEFEIIENDCKIKSTTQVPILIERDIKEKTQIDFLVEYYKSLSFEEVLSSFYQNSYTIQNLGHFSNGIYEKEIRALVYTRYITLELLFIKMPDLSNLKEMCKESIEYIKSAGLSKRNNKWIYTLLNNKIKIEKLISENERKNIKKMNKWRKEINGKNDKENIEFLEYIHSNYYTEEFKKMIDINRVKEMYESKNKDDKKKLRRTMSFAVDHIPGNDKPETKNLIGKFKEFLNVIFAKFGVK